VSLNWLLAKPAVTSVIIGARIIAQLEDNLKAAKWSLSAEEVELLDDASKLDLGYPYSMITAFQSNR